MSSTIATQPDQYDRLTRYIYQSGHFSKVHHRVKQNAFLPEPGKSKISAAWIDGLVSPQIWEIGDLLGAQRLAPAVPIARADFDSAVLPKTRLTIESDPVPHPRHINVCGWPSEKDAQKDIALMLCSKSTLQVR